jgi:enterochelin esterase-like enzyme
MRKNYYFNPSKILVCLVIIFDLLFFSCNKKKVASYDLSTSNIDSIVNLTEWNVLGPIKLINTTKKDSLLHFDHLKQVGISEKKFLENPFMKIKNTAYNVFVSDGLEQEYHKYKSNVFDFSEINNRPNQPVEGIEGSAIYFSCQIVSKKIDTLNLLSKSSDGLKIWVNKTLVNSTGEKRTFNLSYVDYTRIPLKKGTNNLIIKKINHSSKIFFKAILAKDYVRDKLFHEKQQMFLLDKSIVSDTLRTPENFSKILNSPLTYMIKNIHGELVLEHKLSKDDEPQFDISSLLDDHSYLCTFSKNNLLFSQVFYKGNPDDAYIKFSEKRDLYKNNFSAVSQIDTYLYRLNALLNHPSRNTDWWWSHKVSYLLYELENYFINLEAKQSDLLNSTGIQFRAYKSKIDDSIQHYLIITPDEYDESKSLPLVVLVKPNGENHHHFLTSVQVSKIWSISNAKYLANKYGYAILLPSARLYLNEEFVPFVESEILASIEDVEKNYNIDGDRIYLQGNCSAGKRSLILASHYPDKFAAIGLYAPTYVTNSRNQWIKNNSPENLLENIKNTPLFIHYDPTDDHSPYTFYEKLIKDCNQNLMNLTVGSSRLSGLHYNSYLVGEETFSFFKDKKLKKNPIEIKYKSYNDKYNKSYWLKFEKDSDKSNLEISSNFNKKNNTLHINGQNVSSIEVDLNTLPFNEKAPLTIKYNKKEIYSDNSIGKMLAFKLNKKENNIKSFEVSDKNIIDLFGDSFIVVADPEINNTEPALVSVTEEYENYYFSKFPIYSSDCIQNDELKSKNILFIGHQFKNALVNNKIDELPFEVENSLIRIGENNYQGNSISFMKIYRSPFNPDKLICVYTSNNLINFNHSIHSPWIKGFSDLMIN